MVPVVTVAMFRSYMCRLRSVKTGFGDEARSRPYVMPSFNQAIGGWC